MPVDVVVQIGGADVLAGRLWTHRRRNAESATFLYDSSYLAFPQAYELDPALALVAGQQQTAAGRALFGAFSDGAPDRWGRRLISRDEERRGREGGGTAQSFGEADYLLGVRDDLRQGALRFRDRTTGAYLAPEESGIPYLIDLPELLSASEHLERDEATAAELRVLLRTGSSLGGARPKANVMDAEGRIAIAKFPSETADSWDVMRWEYVALRLARDSGIRVADSSLNVIDGRPVLIVQRFDRAGSRRIGYVSAMTMLEASYRAEASYLDIAAVIEEHSPAAGDDLKELWRRIAFSILISNTDDHLRNHGFLRATTAGWSLSPAFDLNPDPGPGPKHLNTAIDYAATEARIDVLLEVAEMFRLDDGEARAVLRDVSDATSRWRAVAAEAGLSAEEIDRMSRAFDHDQTTLARELVSSSQAC